jgi:hypothetical protein
MAWPTKTDFVDGDVLSASQVNNIGTNLNVFNPTAATNGQVWIANGTGSGAYGLPASGSITVLASGNLSTTQLNLTSISSSYEQLQLIIRDARPSTLNNFGLQLNGATGPTLGYAQVRQISVTNQNPAGTTYVQIDDGNFDVASNININIILPDYAVSTAYQYGFYHWNNTTNNSFGGYGTFTYRDAKFAVNAIRLFWAGAATFTQGTYELRGIK